MDVPQAASVHTYIQDWDAESSCSFAFKIMEIVRSNNDET